MPPSPALRYSPGREPRAENHKRGRSLEGGLLFKEKDEDLALFNEMQSREGENFLLQSADDFEDSFCNCPCKLHSFIWFIYCIIYPFLNINISMFLLANGVACSVDELNCFMQPQS
jgi:hypothetical protein